MWKIHVGVKLEGVQANTPQVSVVRTDKIFCHTEYGPKNLRNDLGYIHLGDLVAYKYGNQYYLLVPLEKGDGDEDPAIAVFRAGDLQCLSLDLLRINLNAPQELNDASAWCAVDSEGYVYTSPNFWNSKGNPGVNKLYKYSLNWDEIASVPSKPVKLIYQETIHLLGKDGKLLPPDEISGWAQGGEFSPDGQLLYVSSGYGNDEGEEYGGIHVFDKKTWKRVARSHESGLFNYEWGGIGEEPEGLTIWDLDNGRQSYLDTRRAPNIDGQLHVLLLNIDAPSRDNVYIYHYSNTIYVDHLYNGNDEPNGTISRPYKTVGKALDFYKQHEYFDHGHWTGGRIKIHAGSYNEALTFSRRVQIIPWGGKATVGSKGRIALNPEGAINIETAGALRIY